MIFAQMLPKIALTVKRRLVPRALLVVAKEAFLEIVRDVQHFVMAVEIGAA
jgi:hypothetical protein